MVVKIFSLNGSRSASLLFSVFVSLLISAELYGQTGTFAWDGFGYSSGVAIPSGTEYAHEDFDVDVDYSVTSSGGGFSVPTGDAGHVSFLSSTFGGVSSSLVFGFDNLSDDVDDYITIVVEFSDSLTGVNFTLLDLDRGSSNEWVDGVELFYNGSSNVADNSSLYSMGSRVARDDESYMNGFEGTGNVSSSSGNGNLAVNLGETKVKSLTIKYFSSDDAISNPSTQYIGISDISYDKDCNDHVVTLSMTFDNYPEETSWQITNSGADVVASGGTYDSQPDGSTLDVNVCLPDGDYTLTIFDLYADGMCCSYGSGSYDLRDISSTVLASGASFGASESTNFSLNGGGVLPIELASFTAEASGQEVILNWETKSELNNDFFIIRRSTDFENWTEIARVSGAGTTNINQRYQYRDRDPLEGRSYYYLSQVDFDGTIDHIVAKSVQIGPEIGLTFYPNPVQDLLVVGVDESEISSISLMSLAGARMHLDYTFNGGQLVFDTQPLNSGIYFLQLETHTDVFVERIVVN